MFNIDRMHKEVSYLSKTDVYWSGRWFRATGFSLLASKWWSCTITSTDNGRNRCDDDEKVGIHKERGLTLKGTQDLFRKVIRAF